MTAWKCQRSERAHTIKMACQNNSRYENNAVTARTVFAQLRKRVYVITFHFCSVAVSLLPCSVQRSQFWNGTGTFFWPLLYYVTGFAKRDLFDNFNKIESGSQTSTPTNALYCYQKLNHYEHWVMRYKLHKTVHRVMYIQMTGIIGRACAVRINYRKWVGTSIDSTDPSHFEFQFSCSWMLASWSNSFPDVTSESIKDRKISCILGLRSMLLLWGVVECRPCLFIFNWIVDFSIFLA